MSSLYLFFDINECSSPLTLLHFLPICQSSPRLPAPFPSLTGLDYTIFNHSPTPFFKHKLNSLPFILYLQNPNHGKTLMCSFSALTHPLPSTAVENCAHVQIDTSFTPSPSSLSPLNPQFPMPFSAPDFPFYLKENRSLKTGTLSIYLLMYRLYTLLTSLFSPLPTTYLHAFFLYLHQIGICLSCEMLIHKLGSGLHLHFSLLFLELLSINVLLYLDSRKDVRKEAG